MRNSLKKIMVKIECWLYGHSVYNKDDCRCANCGEYLPIANAKP